MSRAATWRLAGAALMICVTSLDGRDGLMVQIETRKTNKTLVYAFDENGDIIDNPEETRPLLTEGLCFLG